MNSEHVGWLFWVKSAFEDYHCSRIHWRWTTKRRQDRCMTLCIATLWDHFGHQMLLTPRNSVGLRVATVSPAIRHHCVVVRGLRLVFSASVLRQNLHIRKRNLSRRFTVREEVPHQPERLMFALFRLFATLAPDLSLWGQYCTWLRLGLWGHDIVF